MANPIEELLKDYPVTMDIPVLWGDMDAFGHVNNLVYLKWFESARVAYFDLFKGMSVDTSTSIGPILGHTDCRYKIPLEHPDTITVGARVTEIAEDRFSIHHRVVSHQHQKVAAEGSGLIVCVDYKTGKKTSIPPSWLEIIANQEKVA